MDFSRVRTGELIAGVSGIALFVFMFFSWFGVDSPGEIQVPGGFQLGVEGSVDAWEAFDFIDIVLLLAVVGGVGLMVLAAAQSNVQLPVAASAIAAGLGILATLLVLYRVIDPPDIVEGLDTTRKVGVFLGLIASAGIAIGGWMAMQEEGTSFGGEADRLGGGRGPDAGEPPSPPPPPPPPSGGR
jgi:hypothetical protein